MTFVIPGYERARSGSSTVVAQAACLGELVSIVEHQRLHDYAAAQPDARAFRGRGVAYGITLPGACGRVVIRHAHRGGLAASVSSDMYLSRLRPLRELVAAYRLGMMGIPTPEVVAYVIYPVGIMFRYDVATREIETAADLAARLANTTDPEARVGILHATAELVERLAEAGAHHGDLNAKNILLTPSGSGFQGVIIDVDRVTFHVPRSPMVMGANLDRLERSLRKLQAQGLAVSESEIRDLRLRASDLHTRRRAAPDS